MIEHRWGKRQTTEAGDTVRRCERCEMRSDWPGARSFCNARPWEDDRSLGADACGSVTRTPYGLFRARLPVAHGQRTIGRYKTEAEARRALARALVKLREEGKP